MKRLISIALLLCLLTVSCVCMASASEPGTLSAYLLKGELKKDTVITVRFELNGLSETDGAVMTENHFGYDPEVLEYVSCSANHPKDWDFTNEIAEDWSGRDQTQDVSGKTEILDSVNFTIMDAKMEHPVKDDHVLFIDVDFKLKKDVTELSFDAHDCYWVSFSYVEATGKNDFSRFDLADQTLKMSLTAPVPAKPENKGLSTGALIAIIAGAAVVLGGVVTAIVFASKKKKLKGVIPCVSD